MEAQAAIDRARLLIAQQRFDMARDLLRQALVSEPNLAAAHSLLALCLSQDRDRMSEATRTAEQGVFLAPDDGFSHYVLASVLADRNQTDKALVAINEALALAPWEAEYYGLKSQLHGHKNNWKEALQAAEEGLQYDPENEACNSLRTIALERLGKLRDAAHQAAESLRQNPDSTHAHSSHGWALLQRGDFKSAQKSFAEALRLWPNNELARSGMIQALNSSNFVFRWFYLLIMRLGRLSPGVQWALIIGLFLGMRFLGALADRNPSFAPWVLPLLLFYLLFVMMSWIMMPLFNTMLRFHPFGKHLLSKKEVWASNLIAGMLAFSVVIGIIVGVLQRQFIIGTIPILTGLYLTIPIIVPFNCEAAWARGVGIVIAIGFALIYVFLNAALIFQSNTAAMFLEVYMLGILIHCFAGQALIRVKAKY